MGTEQVSSPTLEKGGNGGFEEGKRESNVVRVVFSNQLKIQPGSNGMKFTLSNVLLLPNGLRKVDHYYLSIDAVTQPMQVREMEITYKRKEK
jgi:hypothetical protein